MMSPTTYYRLGLASALGTAVFLLFGIGALGIIGSGGSPDRIYLAVLVVGLLGAVVSRLRPQGMAWALAVTAAAMVVATLVALLAGWHQHAGASLLDIVGLTLMYAGLFGASAWLFLRAGRGSPAAGP